MEQGNLSWETFESITHNCLESVSKQDETNSTAFSLSDTSDYVPTSPTYGPNTPPYHPRSIGYRALNSGYEDAMIRSTRYRAMTPVGEDVVISVTLNNDVGDNAMTPLSLAGPRERVMTHLSPTGTRERSITPVYDPDTPTYVHNRSSYSPTHSPPISPTYSPISPNYSPSSPRDVNEVKYVQDCDGRIHCLEFLAKLDNRSLIFMSNKINNMLNGMEQ